MTGSRAVLISSDEVSTRTRNEFLVSLTEMKYLSVTKYEYADYVTLWHKWRNNFSSVLCTKIRKKLFSQQLSNRNHHDNYGISFGSADFQVRAVEKLQQTGYIDDEFIIGVLLFPVHGSSNSMWCCLELWCCTVPAFWQPWNLRSCLVQFWDS